MPLKIEVQWPKTKHQKPKAQRVMRLDLFLKASRICPRRTVAQQLCDAGHVSVNGASAKSAHAIKPGDEITIKRRDRVSRFKVVIVPEQRQTKKQDARSLYELLDETLTDDFR